MRRSYVPLRFLRLSSELAGILFGVAVSNRSGGVTDTLSACVLIRFC